MGCICKKKKAPPSKSQNSKKNASMRGGASGKSLKPSGRPGAKRPAPSSKKRSRSQSARAAVASARSAKSGQKSRGSSRSGPNSGQPRSRSQAKKTGKGGKGVKKSAKGAKGKSARTPKQKVDPGVATAVAAEGSSGPVGQPSPNSDGSFKAPRGQTPNISPSPQQLMKETPPPVKGEAQPVQSSQESLVQQPPQNKSKEQEPVTATEAEPWMCKGGVQQQGTDTQTEEPQQLPIQAPGSQETSAETGDKQEQNKSAEKERSSVPRGQKTPMLLLGDVQADSNYPSQQLVITSFVRNGRHVKSWSYSDSYAIGDKPPSLAKLLKKRGFDCGRRCGDSDPVARMDAVSYIENLGTAHTNALSLTESLTRVDDLNSVFEQTRHALNKAKDKMSENNSNTRKYSDDIAELELMIQKIGAINDNIQQKK